MKVNFVKSLLLMAAVTLSATLHAQVQMGIQAGVNLSNVTIRDADGIVVDGAKLTPGFRGGLTFDIPAGYEFFIQPGALFSMKGTKLTRDANDYFWADGSVSMGDDHTKLTTYNLEVPVNFIYKPAAGNGNLMIGAGPYFSYALGGTFKSRFDGETTSGDLLFVNDYRDVGTTDKKIFGKPFDVGANLLLGYESMNRFSVQVNGQLGMTNLEPKNDGVKQPEVLRNNSFGITFGYKF